MPAVLALVAFAYGDSRMFLAPAAPNLSPQMAQPQTVMANGFAEPMLPAEPLVPVAYPSPQAPTASSSMVLAAASAVLVAGAALAATSRQETAVAEPDLEAAEDAATVAMLFSSGKAAPKKAAARKPAPKKAAAPKRKPAPKPAPKRKVAPAKRTVTTGGSRLMGGAAKTSGAEKFAKNLFSQENWVFQAFNILKDLPANNAKPNKGKATNNRTGF